ncbi:hypothetical protein, partial [Hyunsoonleella flava]|uniref:hypothetical protein n=1 Tax=Hyunsoonleella flava TaxID=2527939 RepID=UPI0013EF10D9
DGIKGIAYPNIVVIDPKENHSKWEKTEAPDDFKDLVWSSKKDSGLVIINLEEHTSQPKELWNAIKNLDFVQTANNIV